MRQPASFPPSLDSFLLDCPSPDRDVTTSTLGTSTQRENNLHTIDRLVEALDRFREASMRRQIGHNP
jgi:hypothetical protein